jgi:glycosyltransferase involved in cell wall biosynthesis
MRIVFVANWWYRRGGLGAVMLDEAAELALRGHEVIPFAARHPDNLDTPWRPYFPEFRETSDLGASMAFGTRVSTAIRLIRNGEAEACFTKLLDDVKPDLIHLHNTVRQLSPAVLRPARRRGIPVVMTQHDYALICPQGQLYKGELLPCSVPNCVRGNPLPAVAFGCVRRRPLPSLVAATEYALHRTMESYSASVRLLLAPSHFVERSLTAGGLPRNQVRYLPNGVAPGPEPSPVPSVGGHVLYAGRLSREKGLDVLLDAARTMPDIPVMVAGDGPLRQTLESRAPRSVKFVGQRSPEELQRLRVDAVAIVSPSTWHENAPITVLEAMRDGRPVIVSSLGGQPELVEGGAGLVVQPRDPRALVSAIKRIWEDRGLAAEMGRASRKRLMTLYTLDGHVSKLEGIYGEVVGRSGNPPARRHRRIGPKNESEGSWIDGA